MRVRARDADFRCGRLPRVTFPFVIDCAQQQLYVNFIISFDSLKVVKRDKLLSVITVCLLLLI